MRSFLQSLGVLAVLVGVNSLVGRNSAHSTGAVNITAAEIQVSEEHLPAKDKPER